MIHQGDCLAVLKTMQDETVDCCITSPPYYGLRDYGIDGQIGLEQMPEAYVAKLVEVFREVRRVLKPEATLWLNLGDSYVGGPNRASDKRSQANETYRKDRELTSCKPKDLINIP